MKLIPATRARQKWAQTLDQAKKAPVSITEHGRETVVLMDVELGRRALEALKDAEDAREAAEVLSRVESGQEPTYTMAEVAAELGLTEMRRERRAAIRAEGERVVDYLAGSPAAAAELDETSTPISDLS